MNTDRKTFVQLCSVHTCEYLSCVCKHFECVWVWESERERVRGYKLNDWPIYFISAVRGRRCFDALKVFQINFQSNPRNARTHPNDFIRLVNVLGFVGVHSSKILTSISVWPDSAIFESFFLKNEPTPASFSFIFSIFKQTIHFLQQIDVKMSIQYTELGFEPTTFQTSAHNP